MTETILIALNKLDRNPKNVRKTYRTEGVQELAASIKAEGMYRSLIVRKGDKKGRYFVTAGGDDWPRCCCSAKAGIWLPMPRLNARSRKPPTLRP